MTSSFPALGPFIEGLLRSLMLGRGIASESNSVLSSSLTRFLEAKIEATFPLLGPVVASLAWVLGGVSIISITSLLGDDFKLV